MCRSHWEDGFKQLLIVQKIRGAWKLGFLLSWPFLGTQLSKTIAVLLHAVLKSKNYTPTNTESTAAQSCLMLETPSTHADSQKRMPGSAEGTASQASDASQDPTYRQSPPL